MKIAAVSDIHIGRPGFTHVESFKKISQEADVLLLCGDLTDRGTEEQAQILIEELKSCTIPVVAVFGNHDYDKGKEKSLEKILKNANVCVLDGEYTVIGDVGFAGIKGFAGGFDQTMLTSFGEKQIKDYVRESVNNALALESALSQLHTEKKVVLLHYAPISQTVEGEPREIFPFLGSSHLLSPLHRFKVNVVFHGHAHHGTSEGKTEQGIPVYNVAYPLLTKINPEKPYVIVEV